MLKLLRIVGKRLLQAVALVIAGVLFAALVITFHDYSKSHWTPAAIWVKLALFTPITFWGVIDQFRTSWQQRSFWLVISALLVLHLVAYSWFLLQVPDWSSGSFVVMALGEIVGLATVLEWLGFPFAPRLSRKTHRTPARKQESSRHGESATAPPDH